MEEEKKFYYATTFPELFAAYIDYIRDNNESGSEDIVFMNASISAFDVDTTNGIMTVFFTDGNTDDREIPLKKVYY